MGCKVASDVISAACLSLAPQVPPCLISISARSDAQLFRARFSNGNKMSGLESERMTLIVRWPDSRTICKSLSPGSTGNRAVRLMRLWHDTFCELYSTTAISVKYGFLSKKTRILHVVFLSR